MSCAGCDDCPKTGWHLHVTVRPHWSWTLTDVASALRRDIERHGIRPVVVTNHFRDGRPSYKELIPTLHVEGDEAHASREIFRMGVLLNNAGWRVKRLKIEGDARMIPYGRALYYEAHIKSYVPMKLPFSTNAKGESIYTARHADLLDLHMMLDELLQPTDLRRIEATVLDTNPAMDHDWINQ